MSTRALFVGAGLLGAASVAFADIVPMRNGVPVGTPIDEEIVILDYGNNNRSGTPAIPEDDVATAGLMMFTASNVGEFINSGGDANVQRGPDYTDLGENVNTDGFIQAKWDEFTGSSSNTVQAIWNSTDGSEFLPTGTMIGDEAAIFVGWRFGADDPVDFFSWVQSTELIRAIVAFSDDGGQSFNSFDITGAFPPEWDGTDVGITLALVGTGTNLILTQYEFLPIPAPAASLLLIAPAIRRRRR